MKSEIFYAESLKLYKESKRDWMIAQEEIIKKGNNPVYELVKQNAVMNMTVIETLLIRSNIDIKELNI